MHDLDAFAVPLLQGLLIVVLVLLGSLVLSIPMGLWLRHGRTLSASARRWLSWRLDRPQPGSEPWDAFHARLSLWEANRPSR